MFKPKITKGKWGIEFLGERLWVGSLRAIEKKIHKIVCTIDADPGYKKETLIQANENAKAIVAIPQLLDVLEAAREVVETVHCNSTVTLEEAIKKLEEMHGKT